MPSAEKIRWGAERRLEFIEFRLYWRGGIRRADITEKFGVSVPQVFADIGAYQLTAPSNLVYDASEKRYVSTPDFRPVFLDLSARAIWSICAMQPKTECDWSIHGWGARRVLQ